MIKYLLKVNDVKEALIKKKENPDYAFYAGGTEINRLNSTLNYEGAISLEGLGLDKIELTKDGVKIGACVTLQMLIDSNDIPQYLKEAAKFCASRTLRCSATVGGNLAFGSDDSYLMPTLLAAKARLVTSGLTANDVFTEDNMPIREYHSNHESFSNTLLVAIVLPIEERIVLSKRFARTSHAHSAVCVAFGAKKTNNKLDEVRIFAAIKGSGVQRFSDVENSIENDAFNSSADVEFAIANEINAVDDLTGSASYKKYITSVAVAQMYDDAKGVK
ncbi:MAG: FAD binding domain-containing protein [Pleomorphochaeta sp.]